MNLSTEDKTVLLQIARKSIEANLKEKQIELHIDSNEFPVLNSKSGVFVTIKMNGELRGCIGYITTDKPLVETIKDAATGAAFGDPRFPSLEKSEYPDIELELSILSEPVKMKSYDEIEIGKHGLILEEQNKRGLLLPQVPIEHGMNKEEYLTAICRKAGISKDAWMKKTLNMYLFTATVFDESELELDDGSN